MTHQEKWGQLRPRTVSCFRFSVSFILHSSQNSPIPVIQIVSASMNPQFWMNARLQRTQWITKNVTNWSQNYSSNYSIKCAMVKSHYIGDGHPTFNRNPYNGYINPYYWVDEDPLLYGNNGSLDPGTNDFSPNVSEMSPRP